MNNTVRLRFWLRLGKNLILAMLTTASAGLSPDLPAVDFPAADADGTITATESGIYTKTISAGATKLVVNASGEEAQRTSTTCILGYTAMKLGRKLNWDAKAERFVNDDEANGTLFRDERKGFGVKQHLKDLA